MNVYRIFTDFYPKFRREHWDLLQVPGIWPPPENMRPFVIQCLDLSRQHRVSGAQRERPAGRGPRPRLRGRGAEHGRAGAADRLDRFTLRGAGMLRNPSFERLVLQSLQVVTCVVMYSRFTIFWNLQVLHPSAPFRAQNASKNTVCLHFLPSILKDFYHLFGFHEIAYPRQGGKTRQTFFANFNFAKFSTVAVWSSLLFAPISMNIIPRNSSKFVENFKTCCNYLLNFC